MDEEMFILKMGHILMVMKCHKQAKIILSVRQKKQLHYI